MNIEDLIITLTCCHATMPLHFAKPVVLSQGEIYQREFTCPSCGQVSLLSFMQKGRMVNIQQKILASSEVQENYEK